MMTEVKNVTCSERGAEAGQDFFHRTAACPANEMSGNKIAITCYEPIIGLRMSVSFTASEIKTSAPGSLAFVVL